MPREAVLAKLREVPVFGLLAGASDDGRPSFLQAEDGCSSFFLDAREADSACAKLGQPGVRVEGITLDQIYFDQNVRVKPTSDGVRQAQAMVKGGSVQQLSVPLFAIDGMQVQDKETGIDSSPIFFCRKELLEFANTCMDEPEERVLLTDLEVIVSNMLNGPAGMLRNCKLFPTAASLVAMDKQAADKKQQLFPGQGAAPAAAQQIPDVFAGLFNKWS